MRVSDQWCFAAPRNHPDIRAKLGAWTAHADQHGVAVLGVSTEIVMVNGRPWAWIRLKLSGPIRRRP